jgi:2-hydroxychromene-2-carboxylate isomerase
MFQSPVSRDKGGGKRRWSNEAPILTQKPGFFIVELSAIGGGRLMSYKGEMTSQNALANAKLLFKALAAREANLDDPIPDDRIIDVAVQIGLEGDEFDSALDYAADQGWFEDAEVADSASWVSLTPAGVAAAKS